ncbi:MAG: tubulin-like doman-containing protein [Candidatus Methanomethylicaceae archaeon]
MPDVTIPTFVIGLGGIGQQVTFLLADRFENSRWRGVPPTIRIRSFDTAQEESYEIPVSKYRRFTRLGQFDADQVIQNLHLYPEIKAWWNYRYTLGFIGEGAKSERPVGRLVFFRNIDKIYQTLLDDFKAPLADELQRQLISEGLEQVSRRAFVFIIGSLAGGTCSGMLIDTAILVRWLLRHLGYETGGINITAVLGLESVISVVTQNPSDQFALRRRLNVNAALRELDFLQGWQGNIPIRYPQPLSHLEPVPPLFNQIYLFSSRKFGGFFYPNQREILNRVAHFVFGQVASKTGEVARAIMDNVGDYFHPDERTVSDGLKAIYAAFGVEWLEVPRRHLLAAWCQEHAELLGNLVVEIDWTKEPKENLLRKFKELLPPELHGYRRAFAIMEAGPEGILAAPGMNEISIRFEAIHGTRKRQELLTALHDFENELPRLLTKIIRQEVSLGADPSQEDTWLLQAIQTLCRDRGFRLGGARRVLQEGAAHLRRLSALTSLSLPSVNDIPQKCTNLWGKVKDITPALEWAKVKTFQTARQILSNVISQRSEALAAKMEECAQGLQRLQEKIRELTRQLRGLQTPGDTVPQEAWLLNPSDIKVFIKDNPEEVARRGADEIAEKVAAELSLSLLRGQETGFVERNLRYWIESALEKAIETRIQPPRDRVIRVKQRMTQCEPMAFFITSGVEFDEVMQDKKPAILKIVLTGADVQAQEELRQWATEENLKLGGTNVYQVFPHEEPLRDDVLHLTCGWPLWLVDEVRFGETLLEQAKISDPRYHKSFLLIKQIPSIEEHQIKPIPESDAKTWFGIALALRDIDFGAKEIRFNPKRFSGVIPIKAANLKSCLERSYQVFRQQGWASAYKLYIRSELESDKVVFKKRLEEGLASRLELLKRAYEAGEVTEEEFKILDEYYRLAQEYAKGIVIL